ncbi:hypothetical protein [Providencia rettgeri]|uniref:hypothetical protein n=1 Tax=Providencia rettgeri TaxID=587 RepID=UPI0034E0D9F9
MSSATEKQNDNAFKHLFNEKLLLQLAELIGLEYPEFKGEALHHLTHEFPQLEMKARVRAIRDVLIKQLPADYPVALNIIVSVLEQNSLQGFAVWPFAEFIQSQGLAYPEISLLALKLLTTYLTASLIGVELSSTLRLIS